jgi:hypothetical protein
MAKKWLVIVVFATCVSLYYFPKQDTFWAFMSISSYVAVCSALIALFISCRALQRIFTYWLQTRRLPKESVMAVFYAVILVILILFLPMFSSLFLCTFILYRWWQFFQQRQVLHLPKKQQ